MYWQSIEVSHHVSVILSNYLERLLGEVSIYHMASTAIRYLGESLTECIPILSVCGYFIEMSVGWVLGWDGVVRIIMSGQRRSKRNQGPESTRKRRVDKLGCIIFAFHIFFCHKNKMNKWKYFYQPEKCIYIHRNIL